MDTDKVKKVGWNWGAVDDHGMCSPAAEVGPSLTRRKAAVWEERQQLTGK